MSDIENLIKHKQSTRQLKIASVMQRALMGFFLKDVENSMVTVTEVNVSPDCKNAKVYCVFSCDNTQDKLAQLNNETKHIHHHIRSAVSLRYTPRLSFYHDKLPDHISKIEELLLK